MWNILFLQNKDKEIGCLNAHVRAPPIVNPTSVSAEQAMFSGQADLAMKTAREMESILPPGDETRSARVHQLLFL